MLGVVDDDVVEANEGGPDRDGAMIFVAAEAGAAHGALEPAQQDQLGLVGQSSAQAAPLEGHSLI